MALSAFKWKDHKEFEATESWFLHITVSQHLTMSVKTFVTILLHFPIQITIQDWHFEISLLWRLFSESTITGVIADGRARTWRKRCHFKFRRLSVDMSLTDSPRHQLLIVRCCQIASPDVELVFFSLCICFFWTEVSRLNCMKHCF